MNSKIEFALDSYEAAKAEGRNADATNWVQYILSAVHE